MVKFLDVNPDEFDNTREGRRGRVAYPILKEFLETGKFMAQLDRTGMQQSFQSLCSTLNAYIRNHVMPIKIITRQMQIYLMRLDVDKEGKAIPDWVAKSLGAPLLLGEAPVIDAAEVQKRMAVEINKSTK